MIYLSIIFLLLLSSCSDEQKAINLSGDGRNNNYSDRSVFSSDYFVLKILESDSLPIKSKEGLKWPLLMNANGGIIWCGNDNKIKLLAGSKFRWEYDLEENKIVAPYALSPDSDLIYITNDNKVNSLNDKGKLNWRTPISDSSDKIFYNSVLTLDKYFIISSSDNKIIFIDYNGKILSELTLPISPIGDPILLNDSTIIITASHYNNNKSDLIYFIQNQKFTKKIELTNSRIINGAISSGDKIFLSSMKNIICLDISGKIIWEKPLPFPSLKLSSDDAGNLYCLIRNNSPNKNENWIYKINNKGEVDWKFFLRNKVISDLLIGEENIAFYATQHNTQGLFYLNKHSGKLYYTLSLSMAPALNPYPAISNNGILYFGSANSNQFVKIEKDFLDWR